MTNYILTKEYKTFFHKIKENIQRSRQIAILKINNELINLYYNLGKEIYLKQKESDWGSNLIGQIEKDLKKEFPNVKGFSRRNLFYMKKFYLFFKTENVPQLVAQLPWNQVRIILDKIKNKKEALFYIQESINNTWSKVLLEHQIELNLYERKGKINNNFLKTLPKKDSNFIQNYFKENYILDFLNVSEEFDEKELENAIVSNITKFLIELGKGFAFIGKQFKIIVGNKDFYIDLLFYNYILKRFIVIELKTKEFKPEYLGQIGFYINVINKNIKKNNDDETIGLLICKSKNKTIVEYALLNNKQPLGIAEYKLSKIPKNISKYLPNKEDFKKILS
jgi:predicted nuclease of restriction endonuclease-like (RecB) superfamily